MSGVETRNVGTDEDGLRLDRWFRLHYPTLPHGRLQKLLRTGQVRVDGARVKAQTRLASGQAVRVPPLPDSDGPVPPPRRREISAADRRFMRDLVIHRDDHVLVLNKPSGLAVQGGTRTERHLDGLLDALQFDAPERPRLVHRLDRDTSGVLLLGRTRKAAAALGRAFKSHEAQKIYWALVHGAPRPNDGTVNAALVKAGREGEQRVRAAAADMEDAQKAVTHYLTIAQAGTRAAWLALLPVTGRTHQLRVHMAAIGHPIVGDGKYGLRDQHPGDEIARKLHLHARSISLPHPAGGRLEVTADLPAHMRATWAFLGFDEAAGDAIVEEKLS